MARDYAKYANTPRKPVKKQRELDTFVILLIALVLLGAGYGFYAYKIRPVLAENKSLSGLFSSMKTFFHHKTPVTTVATKTNANVIKPDPEVHFDFYNQLPNMQVRIAAPQSTTTATSSQPGYVLQLSLFDNLNEASEARISYLLAGADVNIAKVGNSYRIQQGPYSSLTTAKAMQKKLQKKGIETVLKKTTA